MTNKWHWREEKQPFASARAHWYNVTCKTPERRGQINYRWEEQEEEERQKAKDAGCIQSAQPSPLPALDRKSICASVKLNFHWSHQLKKREKKRERCVNPTLHILLFFLLLFLLLPPPARSIRRTDFTPTGGQTRGQTQARHDARISPSWDSCGGSSAFERAAVCSGGCGGGLDGASSGPAARGRTGRGAPTCCTTWVPECEEGRMLGYIADAAGKAQLGWNSQGELVCECTADVHKKIKIKNPTFYLNYSSFTYLATPVNYLWWKDMAGFQLVWLGCTFSKFGDVIPTKNAGPWLLVNPGLMAEFH